jgi:hypothetical protein
VPLKKSNAIRKVADKAMKSKILQNKLIDRLLLILTAIVCLGIFTAVNLYLGFGLRIHKNTITFFMCVVMYILITYFLAIKNRKLKGYCPKWVPILVLFFLILIPVIISFLVFDLLIGSFPSTAWDYGPPALILGTSTLILFDMCLGLLSKRGYIKRIGKTDIMTPGR